MFNDVALIKNVDLILDEPCGVNGLNCTLTLLLEFKGGSFCSLNFNPCLVPTFLDKFNCKKLSELEGLYLETNSKEEFTIGCSNDVIVGVRPILSNSDDDWIEFCGDCYWGSKFIPI